MTYADETGFDGTALVGPGSLTLKGLRSTYVRYNTKKAYVVYSIDSQMYFISMFRIHI
jgi:hypothetical protein